MFLVCFGQISSVISSFSKNAILILRLGTIAKPCIFSKKRLILHLKGSLFRCGFKKFKIITFLNKEETQSLLSKTSKIGWKDTCFFSVFSNFSWKPTEWVDFKSVTFGGSCDQLGTKNEKIISPKRAGPSMKRIQKFAKYSQTETPISTIS